MDELKEVKRVINPTEVLLVVDAMTGQEAAGTSFSNLGRPEVLKLVLKITQRTIKLIPSYVVLQPWSQHSI